MSDIDELIEAAELHQVKVHEQAKRAKRKHEKREFDARAKLERLKMRKLADDLRRTLEELPPGAFQRLIDSLEFKS